MSSLESVSIFVEVASAGSFVGAAQKLGLTRSAVSRRVAELEGELGVRLLHRTTRRLSLTGAGQLLFERAAQGLQAIHDARRDVISLAEEPSGKLAVSVPMSFGLLHIAPLMAEFRRRHPGLEIKLEFDDRKVDLVSEGFDLALRIGALPSSSLIARHLAEVSHMVVAAPELLSQGPWPADPGELTDHQCLIYSLRANPRSWRFKLGAIEREVRVTGQFEANNSLALREMALAGLGFALAPTFLVSSDVASGALVQVLPDWQAPKLALHAVFPSRRHVSPAVRAFVEFIEGRIGRPPIWDAKLTSPVAAQQSE